MCRRTLVLGVIFATSACTPHAIAPAAQSTQGPAQCFWASSVSGFSDAGPDRALVRIGGREMWEMTLSPGCPDVNWAMKIGIVSRGGERICTDRPAELVVPSASGSSSQRCLVRTVRKLSPEESAAARRAVPPR
ncbi:MAG: DUF6491 family protein [Sphingomicrobium sp.]